MLKAALVTTVILTSLFGATAPQAAPVAVVNAGVEAAIIPGNAFVVLQPQGWLPYDPSNLLVNQPGANAIGVIRPLAGSEFFPDGTTEGDNAALVFLAGAGTGEAGLRQTLAATLQSGQRYTLRVDIGNIASGTSLAGSSGGAGVFFDLDGFPGYRLDLMAGGPCGVMLAVHSSRLRPNVISRLFADKFLM